MLCYLPPCPVWFVPRESLKATVHRSHTWRLSNIYAIALREIQLMLVIALS